MFLLPRPLLTRYDTREKPTGYAVDENREAGLDNL